jgi:hypothetical protein
MEKLSHPYKVKKLPSTKNSEFRKFKLSGTDITLPGFVAFSLSEQNYRDVARLGRFGMRNHVGFGGHFVTLLPIAGYAGRDHIGPFGFPTPRTRNNVVYRQRMLGSATVLTGVIITG